MKLLLRFLLPVLLIFAGLTSASAQARILSVHFLPPEYYVGDTVELRVVVAPDDGAPIEPPAALPKADWILFKDARVEKAGDTYELRIFFSSFAPGTRTLPDIAFGGFVLQGIKIHTTSILKDGEGDLADLQGQLYLPGTLPLMIFTIFLVFTGPLLIIAASGLIRRRLKNAALYLSRRRPYWKLKRDLKELGSQALMMPDRDFYYRLSDAVRSYISRRTGGDCITTTIHEIRTMMQAFFPSGDTAMRLIHFLEYADTIKFAGVEAGASRKGDDLLRLGELAAAMEEQCRERESRQEQKQEASRVDI